MALQFLVDGPEKSKCSILLAHGAGAPMDSPAMDAITRSLAEVGLRVARFEFGYMASHRTSSSRKPPPRAETLCPEYVAAIAALKARGPLIIGGKSMGGRVASMIADEHRAAGLLCLGYPFHPVSKPTQLRTAHLAELRTPTLIVQGTRDPFGGPDEVREAIADADPAPPIEVMTVEGGDHSFAVLKSSGRDQASVHKEIQDAVAAWIATRR